MAYSQWKSVAVSTGPHNRPVLFRSLASVTDLGVDPSSRLESICTFQVGSDYFSLPLNRIYLVLCQVNFFTYEVFLLADIIRTLFALHCL